MRWPWTKPEKRESQPFTDALTQAIVAAAGGKTTASPSATAALEAAAGTVARAMAGADVSGAGMAERALTPHFLGLVGRDLIRRGESLFLIDVHDDIRLFPCRQLGRARRMESRHLGIPPRLVRADPATSPAWCRRQSVLHFRYAFDPARPWLGLSPIAWARTTGRLLAQTEVALADEASMPVGADHPDTRGPGRGRRRGGRVRSGGHAGRPREPPRPRDARRDDNAGAWGQGAEQRPQMDWKPNRIGANPPSSLVSLRSDAAQAVLSACGVPASLFTEKDGTAAREGFRRLLTATLQPIAKLCVAELAEKLDTPDLHFSFDNLYAHDLVGRASAFKGLVAGGAEVQQALIVSGLLTVE